MGKLKVPANVNLQESTIGDCLKQIKRSNSLNTDKADPLTLEVWVCDVLPSQTKAIVAFIENFLKPFDSSNYSHIKRFKKLSVDSKTYISSVLCSVALVECKTAILDLLRREFDPDFKELLLSKKKIPAELPNTKELAMEWSTRYWPLSWKGNPNHQQLVTVKFDIEEERKIIALLLERAKSMKLMVTIIARKDADEGSIKILQIAYDNSKQNILSHSTMKAISAIAEEELKYRQQTADGLNQGYLCHNLLVYTTHEPCTMCAMALVHSRIGRLIYIWNHGLGAVESSYYIGDRTDLNWTFDIWRWVGPECKEELEWTTAVCP